MPGSKPTSSTTYPASDSVTSLSETKSNPTTRSPNSSIQRWSTSITPLADLQRPNGIKVSSAFIYGVIGVSYPPSQGDFNKDLWSIVEPILKFLVKNRCPLLLNVYPFFAYLFNPGQIRLDYALFTPPAGLVPDPPLSYGNLFDAMVDAAYSALEKAGAGELKIVVAETGWTTDGAGNATTVENARLYNNNLVKHVMGGTPKRPGKEIETYIFGLFDEDLKSPETEKHWGVFSPDKNLKYPMNFRT